MRCCSGRLLRRDDSGALPVGVCQGDFAGRPGGREAVSHHHPLFSIEVGLARHIHLGRDLLEVASANGARRQHDHGAGGLGLWVLVVVGAAAGDEDGIARPDQLHLAIDSRG